MSDEVKTINDYEYTPEELDELEKRASGGDRISLISFNKYKLSNSNVFLRLKNILEAKIETSFIEPLLNDQFRITEGGEVESIMMLLDKLDRWSKGVGVLSSMGNKNILKPTEKKSITQVAKEISGTDK